MGIVKSGPALTIGASLPVAVNEAEALPEPAVV
jgi:hypothetical protein